MFFNMILSALLAGGGPTATAELCPPLARTPGYTGVLLHLIGGTGGADEVLTIKILAPGGHTTSAVVGLRVAESKDLLLPIYCSEAGPVIIKSRGPSESEDKEIARVEAVSGKAAIFSIGDLQQAELASDYFEIGLPNIIKSPKAPLVGDVCVFDGFDGIYSPAAQASVFDSYQFRGGFVAIDGIAPPPRPFAHDGNSLARAAADFPSAGLRPRDFVNLQSLPPRLVFAFSAVGAAIVLLLMSRQKLMILLLVLWTGASCGALYYWQNQIQPAFVVRSLGADDLVLSHADPRPRLADRLLQKQVVVYPCGSSVIRRALSPNGSDESTDGSLLYASAAPATPTSPSAAPTTPFELLQFRLRAPAAKLAFEFGAKQILYDGANGLVLIDRMHR